MKKDSSAEEKVGGNVYMPRAMKDWIMAEVPRPISLSAFAVWALEAAIRKIEASSEEERDKIWMEIRRSMRPRG